MKSWTFSRNNAPQDRASFNQQFTSLMWPDGHQPEQPPPANWQQDLGIDDLSRAFSIHPRYRGFIQQTLKMLPDETDVITWRQAVLQDLMQNPDFVEQVEALLPYLADMQEDHSLLGRRKRGMLMRTSERLSELEIYTQVTDNLHSALQNARLQSAALTALREQLTTIIQDDNYQHLKANLPELREPLHNISSLTVGINLDLELRPKSAVLMAVNDYEINEPLSFLERIIGPGIAEGEQAGIASLHKIPGDYDQRPLSPLFQDLDQLMTKVTEPIERFLRQYTRTNTAPLVNLEYELMFFISAIKLRERLIAASVPLCVPEVATRDERITQIDGLVNPGLALRDEQCPVASDAYLDQDGRIAILTGPNSGGKTTYVQSVGLAQVLFQAGLFIPARSARISPVETICTHFPALETREKGRLAEEAERLRDIFSTITPYSMVLLNETFATTAANEALYLAQDLVSGLRAIGVRAVYATHLSELAHHIDEIEANVEGNSKLFSLVAGITFDENHEGRPTFEIRRRAPLGRSYAREIARRHGIDLDGILKAYHNANNDGQEA